MPTSSRIGGNVKRSAEDEVTDADVETDTDALEFRSQPRPDVKHTRRKATASEHGNRNALQPNSSLQTNDGLSGSEDIPRIIILTACVVRRFQYWSRVLSNYSGQVDFPLSYLDITPHICSTR